MRSIIISGFALVMLSLAACGSTESKPPAKKYKYVCTMHSEIGSDKPGVCPKCGMDLVEQDTTK
jgi:hypothetical protein